MVVVISVCGLPITTRSEAWAVYTGAGAAAGRGAHRPALRLQGFRVFPWVVAWMTDGGGALPRRCALHKRGDSHGPVVFAFGLAPPQHLDLACRHFGFESGHFRPGAELPQQTDPAGRHLPLRRRPRYPGASVQ